MASAKAPKRSKTSTKKPAPAKTKRAAPPAKKKQAKPAPPTKTAKLAPAKTAKPAAKKPKPAPAQTAKPAPARKPAAPPPVPRQVIGEVTAPSGRLALFDVGLLGYLPRPALEPAMIVVDVPDSRALPVVGQRLGTGRFADCWDHVAIVIGPGPVHSSTKLGEAGVDFARLIAIDHEALDAWQHEESLDGRADFVFWGRDAAHLARALVAPGTTETSGRGRAEHNGEFGWHDLPLAQAEARADQAGRLKAEHRWLLATDFRPHSHHYFALAEARKSPHGAGVITIGRARACLFFTSWGDGVFPVFLDRDKNGEPVQVRVQLAAADAAGA